MTIRPLTETDLLPMELLLLADPSEEQVRAYLNQSAVLVAVNSEVITGVVVMYPLTSQRMEIKNIAVRSNQQGRGIGKQLIEAAIAYANQHKCNTLTIGTGNSSIGQLALYQKMGFSMTELWVDYFVKQYPDPIFENGIQCRHMIRLERQVP